MARTLSSIQRQIEKLQQLAERIKAKEAVGVIERIRVAIAHYDLTPEDLFHTELAHATGRKTKSRTGKSADSKKPPSPIRFLDDKGNTWTGHGQRPRWFKEALANGMTREDLAVKP